MASLYRTIQGDRLDQICKRHYGTERNRITGLSSRPTKVLLRSVCSTTRASPFSFPTSAPRRYRMKLSLAAVVLLAIGGIAAAQHQHGNTPYAGLHQRAVKALSEEQIADLRTGRGMSLALAAELNGYPGPFHVLEFAAQLQLTDEQRSRVSQFSEGMKAEAMAVGEKLIEHEKAPGSGVCRKKDIANNSR